MKWDLKKKAYTRLATDSLVWSRQLVEDRTTTAGFWNTLY